LEDFGLGFEVATEVVTEVATEVVTGVVTEVVEFEGKKLLEINEMSMIANIVLLTNILKRHL